MVPVSYVDRPSVSQYIKSGQVSQNTSHQILHKPQFNVSAEQFLHEEKFQDGEMASMMKPKWAVWCQ